MGDIGRGLLHGVKKITKCIIITAQQIGKKKKNTSTQSSVSVWCGMLMLPSAETEDRNNAAFFPNPNKNIARAAASAVKKMNNFLLENSPTWA